VFEANLQLLGVAGLILPDFDQELPFKPECMRTGCARFLDVPYSSERYAPTTHLHNLH
jgi:hypothetical protein